jgi:hypothetical protein
VVSNKSAYLTTHASLNLHYSVRTCRHLVTRHEVKVQGPNGKKKTKIVPLPEPKISQVRSLWQPSIPQVKEELRRVEKKTEDELKYVTGEKGCVGVRIMYIRQQVLIIIFIYL